MIELASLIIELTGSSSRLVYRDLPEGDPKPRRPDIRLAKMKLGWSPKVGVLEGLRPTIEHFQSH